MMLANKSPINVSFTRKINRRLITTSSFYTDNDLYKYNNKNVMYIAYVGEINNEHIYKYGISGKVYEREYNSHRQNFDLFEMKIIKITDNKDVIEDIFEKEMLIRNIHRSIIINSKKQTELFTVNELYTFSYISKLFNRIIIDNPSFETIKYINKIKKLENQLEIIKLELELEKQKN